MNMCDETTPFFEDGRGHSPASLGALPLEVAFPRTSTLMQK